MESIIQQDNVVVPNIKWAQSVDNVFITVNICNAKDIILNIKENFIDFNYLSNKKYHFEGELYSEIDNENYKVNVQEMYILIILNKKENGGWNSLFKDRTLYKYNISNDWSRWEDSDDEEDTNDVGNMDYASMMKQMEALV